GPFPSPSQGLPGLDAALASDVPIGAGLSSSAAVSVAFVLAWNELASLGLPAIDLARVCQGAENEYAGVSCGLMDPFAVLFGREGSALLLDCRTLEWEPVPLPSGTVVAIADSGVRRELAGSSYNARRRECEEAVRNLAARKPGVQSLRDVSPADVERNAGALPEPLLSRARHVAGEIERVRDASARRGDAAAFGRAMTASHASLRDLYEVSSLELDALVSAALAISGCHGARLTGAGFGGCAVALVQESGAMKFKEELAREYARRTGKTAWIHPCRPADGASVETLL
ncbi:MAG: galactokinase, partial [Planctomycetes bacterium]|nr:galactokinase [Planctomycetota bacterium]